MIHHCVILCLLNYCVYSLLSLCYCVIELLCLQCIIYDLSQKFVDVDHRKPASERSSSTFRILTKLTCRTLEIHVGKTIFVKFQAHIVFCFGVFGVFVCFSGADFIFYDFAFSGSRHLWRRKM